MACGEGAYVDHKYLYYPKPDADMATYMSIRVCTTECPPETSGTMNIMSSYADGSNYITNTT
jgi:hypothetical protein